jgi:6,7-dimethyl-8-ribityllumazine synthase
MSEQWPGDPEDDDEPDEANEPDDEDAEVIPHDHADDGIDIPDDVELLEGEARNSRRGVGVVLARTNPETANTMLQAALEELDRVGVGRENVTVMLVPGSFELALGAMALAKTRRYSCVVALGDASEHQIVASETASGLQLAGLETGIPVSFGVLIEAGDASVRAVEAVDRGLEMADLFRQLRAAAKAH